MTNAMSHDEKQAFREITLRNGMKTLVDAPDYFGLRDFKWLALKQGNVWYAYRLVETRPSTHPEGQDKRKVWLHRQIMGAQKGQIIDHINRDGLDNRRGNLRFCTTALNVANGRARRPGFRGVYRDRQKWLAKISNGPGKSTHLGMFDTEEDAALAYDAAARIRFGEFASLNFHHEAIS